MRRRDIIKTVPAVLGATSIATGQGTAVSSDLETTTVTDPEQQESNNDDFTVCDPNYCAYGESLWVNHRGTLEYYGMTPRPEPTGTDKWGHILRIGGRGESVQYSDNKEDGGYFGYLIGHGINIHNWTNNTDIWQPNETQQQGKLGATPAEENRAMDSTERAENLFNALLGLTPGLGEVSTAATIANNLTVDANAGSDTFEWTLDSISGIDYEKTSVTNHFVEFEARAEPGELVEGRVDTKSYLSYELEANSPVGLKGYATLQTTSDPVPTSTTEALEYGYDIALRPGAEQKYDISSGEISPDNIDVQDVIVPPGSGTGIDLVTF